MLAGAYQSFLGKAGLYDEGDADFTALLLDEDEHIAACGSLKGNILKQIAVDPDAEGGGYCAEIVSALISEAFSRGEYHLFLFTKPKHLSMFNSMGFDPLVSTDDMLMMENTRGGLKKYLDALPHYNREPHSEAPSGKVNSENADYAENVAAGTSVNSGAPVDGRRYGIGAIVCNCNPFTLGHRRLIEYAAKRCRHLLVFVLSEDLSMFPADVRYELVKKGTADIKNADIIQSSDYLISRATFPAYFLKDTVNKEAAKCELDLRLFGERIAPALGIEARFVGEEPFDEVTAEYNRAMKRLLPGYGIDVIEIPRYEGISASKVRQLIKDGKIEETEKYLPKTTFEYIQNQNASF